MFMKTWEEFSSPLPSCIFRTPLSVEAMMGRFTEISEIQKVC